MATARTILSENIDRLERYDQGFARSLLSAAFPSETQLSYIEELAVRAMPRPVHRIAHSERIFRLFEHAATHLKRTGISLRLPTFSLRIELHKDVLKLSNDFRSLRDQSGMAICGATAPLIRAPPGRRTSPLCCMRSRGTRLRWRGATATAPDTAASAASC